MSFELESEMSQIVIETLPASLGLADRYAYGFEVPLGYRHIDLGLISLPPFTLDPIELPWLKKLQVKDLWDLAVKFQSDEIFSNSHILSEGTDTSSTTGKDENDLHLTQDLIQDLKEFATGDAHPLIFVELKLENWKEALSQAKFCFRAGSIACVVINSDTISSVPEQAFESEGIGLFSAWRDNVELIVPPKFRKADSDLQTSFHRLKVLRDLTSHRTTKWQIARN